MAKNQNKMLRNGQDPLFRTAHQKKLNNDSLNLLMTSTTAPLAQSQKKGLLIPTEEEKNEQSFIDLFDDNEETIEMPPEFKTSTSVKETITKVIESLKEGLLDNGEIIDTIPSQTLDLLKTYAPEEVLDAAEVDIPPYVMGRFLNLLRQASQRVNPVRPKKQPMIDLGVWKNIQKTKPAADVRTFLTQQGNRGALYTVPSGWFAMAAPERVKTFIDGTQANIVKYNDERFKTAAAPKAARTAGHLQAFPAWAQKYAAQTQKLKRQNARNNAAINGLTQPNYAPYKVLGALDSNLASWDKTSKVWTGSAVRKINQRAIAAPTVYSNKMQKAEGLFNTQLTQAQANAQIPTFIRQIVQANDVLSDTGFGPINSNSAALYAGRWLDSATGNIRVLPTANSRYLNPTSAPQKLGYLQAKMINHWNNLVSTAEQYYKLSRQGEGDKYKARKQQSIKRGLNPSDVNKATDQKIDTMIIKVIQARQTGVKYLGIGKYKGKILEPADNNVLGAIYHLKPAEKQVAWNNICYGGYSSQLTRMVNAKYPAELRARQTAKLTRAYLDLVDSKTNMVRNSLLQAAKAKLIPQDANAKQMMTIAQNIDVIQKQINQRLTNEVIKGHSADQLLNAVKGQDLFAPATVDDIKNSLAAKKITDTAFRLLKPADVPTPKPLNKKNNQNWIQASLKGSPLTRTKNDYTSLTTDGKRLLGL